MFHHSCTRKRLRFMDKRRLYKLSTGLITISLYIKKIRYKHHPNPAPAPPAQRPDAGKSSVLWFVPRREPSNWLALSPSADR